jgi:mono/diheme cytochrome c family protein
MSLATTAAERPGAASLARSTQMTSAQSHYLEGCGGCHGIQGISSKQDIPQLRGLVGRYLCTAAGRAYLVRLPNVAFADMDDELLAAVMNFVAFRLGDGSAPADAVAYSPREVADLRRRPLKNERLAQLRATVLADAISHCAQKKETPATR